MRLSAHTGSVTRGINLIHAMKAEGYGKSGERFLIIWITAFAVLQHFHLRVGCLGIRVKYS